MLTGTSTESATAFIASYHRPLKKERAWLRPPETTVLRPVAMHTRERWAWFRIDTLTACFTWPKTTASLFELFGIVNSIVPHRLTSHSRVARRNLRNMVCRGFLVRSDDGYKTTERGRRVLADLNALSLDNAERAP